MSDYPLETLETDLLRRIVITLKKHLEKKHNLENEVQPYIGDLLDLGEYLEASGQENERRVLITIIRAAVEDDLMPKPIEMLVEKLDPQTDRGVEVVSYLLSHPELLAVLCFLALKRVDLNLKIKRGETEVGFGFKIQGSEGVVKEIIRKWLEKE
jgi:hypothetical protein